MLGIQRLDPDRLISRYKMRAIFLLKTTPLNAPIPTDSRRKNDNILRQVTGHMVAMPETV